MGLERYKTLEELGITKEDLYKSASKARCPNCFAEIDFKEAVQSTETPAVCPECMWTADWDDQWAFLMRGEK